MSNRSRQIVALALAIASAVTLLAGAGLLAAQAIIFERGLVAETDRLEQLAEEAHTDAEAAEAVHAEQDRQRDASLDRETLRARLAPVLIIAAAGLILSVKWLIRLRTGRIALPRKLVQLSISINKQRATETTGDDGQQSEPPHVSLPVVQPQASSDIDLSHVDAIVQRIGRQPAAVIPILQAIQTHYRYLPEPALQRVCELTKITPTQIAGVASFYTQFRRTPTGEHLIRVCHGTACHVAGAPRITEELRRQLNIAPGQDTDPAGRFTIEPVACMGCCTLAPVAQVDDQTHGHLVPDTAVEQLCHCADQANVKTRQKHTTPHNNGQPIGEVRIGLGSCCVANGSGDVQDAIRNALAEARVSTNLKRVGCVGMCHQTPLLEIDLPGRPPARYARVQPEQARRIIRKHFRPPHAGQRLIWSLANTIDTLFEPAAARELKTEHNIELRDPPVAAFLGPQKHIATEYCGDLDPLDLDEYIARGGFEALKRCLHELASDEIIEQIDASGLRGRGGAGFPTAEKWRRVRAATGEQKYIICNGDEGDPGAFMDRMLMESYPYRIIEGIAIAARAVGASEGCLYIRREYPLAVERINAAIRECEARGLLGENIFDTEHSLRLRVVEGAGAFVCGEETALIASLEGQRGMPALRPPYPADSGLNGRPTLVNNVETYAVVPWIIRHGADAFASLGTASSKGTKVFALAGKVRRGGLIEVPMGVTIRQIVEEIGGGARPEMRPFGEVERQFKAVQIGGPSGGCVPAELADTPIDYEALAKVGAIMGSGGLVVLDDTDCIVDIARYFLSFTQDQSCGKCTPCRIGTRRMLEILDRICEGRGQAGDLEKLESLAHSIKAASLCGLGKTAPNPVLTMLRYFRDECEAHLAGRCPAGKCKELIRYEITDACTGCTLCAQQCPVMAIPLTPYERHEIDDALCTRCDSCRVRCPEDAIRITDRQREHAARNDDTEPKQRADSQCLRSRLTTSRSKSLPAARFCKPRGNSASTFPRCVIARDWRRTRRAWCAW